MYLFILAYLILLLSLFTYDERFNLPTGEILSPNQIPKLQVDKLEPGTLADTIKVNARNIQGPGTLPDNVIVKASNIQGLTGTDLSGYVSSNSLTSTLGNYAPKADYALSSTLGNYALKTDLNGYAPKAEYALKSELSTAGAGYKANDNATFGTVTCSSLTISSDRRIKKNIQPLVSLDLLRKLKPVRYQLKNGQKEVCGFIAQEIQETIPEAVSIQTGVMSNICDEATVDKDILTFSTFLTRDLSYDPEEKPYKLKVDEFLVVFLEVLDEHRVRIDKELISKVYVLGQEVSDFLSIDSHQIFTVATCALQELDAKVHEMDAKVQRLEELDQKVQRLEEENKALLQRFNRLEECLNSRTV